MNKEDFSGQPFAKSQLSLLKTPLQNKKQNQMGFIALHANIFILLIAHEKSTPLKEDGPERSGFLHRRPESAEFF